MKVGRLGFNSAAQQIINVKSHGFTCPSAENRTFNVALGEPSGKRNGMK
jgi:hypothetical protein